MGCNVKLLFWRQIQCHCSQPNFELHVMPTSEAAFGKGGILRLGFRKTDWHIAALTLEQMCRLFYLKRATLGSKEKRLAAASPEFSSAYFTTASCNFYCFAAPEPWRSSMWYWLTWSSTICEKGEEEKCAVSTQRWGRDSQQHPLLVEHSNCRAIHAFKSESPNTTNVSNNTSKSC